MSNEEQLYAELRQTEELLNDANKRLAERLDLIDQLRKERDYWTDGYNDAVRHYDITKGYLKAAVGALFQIWRKDVVDSAEFAYAALRELPSAGAYEADQAPRNQKDSV